MWFLIFLRHRQDSGLRPIALPEDNRAVILEIVHYGHPALRMKGRRIAAVDAGIRKLAADMLETMTAANGVGLAAQQVGRPLLLCVLDISCVTDRPSRMFVEGREVDAAAWMPLVLINPEISVSGRERSATEGCLSFPDLSGEVPRPERTGVRATGLDGRPLEFEATGLLSRALQHEFDHLQGILYIDRMATKERRRLDGPIQQLLEETASKSGMPARA